MHHPEFESLLAQECAKTYPASPTVGLAVTDVCFHKTVANVRIPIAGVTCMSAPDCLHQTMSLTRSGR